MIASFRAVLAGTAGARDTGFVFGVALPAAAVAAVGAVVGGGLSVVQPTAPRDSGSMRRF